MVKLLAVVFKILYLFIGKYCLLFGFCFEFLYMIEVIVFLTIFVGIFDLSNYGAYRNFPYKV